MKKLTIQWFTGHEHRDTNHEAAVLRQMRLAGLDTTNVAIATDHPFGEYTGKVQFFGPEEALRPIAEQFADEERGEKVEDI